MKKIFAILGIAFAIACFTSCKDEVEPFIEATGISLNTTTLSIYPGDWVAIENVVSPSNASSTYKTWSSSDTKVASVDGWGRVYGVAPGNCVITVKTAAGQTASCEVTVKPIIETEISIEQCCGSPQPWFRARTQRRFHPHEGCYLQRNHKRNPLQDDPARCSG